MGLLEMQAEKEHTPGLLAAFIAVINISTKWLFHLWLSVHLLPLREARAGARAEAREEPPDWLVPQGFLIQLSYTTQKQLSRGGIAHSGLGPSTSVNQ